MTTRIDINKLLRASPVDGKRGAPMGRYDRIGPCSGLYCQRVRFVSGDYSPDGTYWGGGGGSLYAMFTPDLETLVFARGATRADAIRDIRRRYARCHGFTLKIPGGTS